jgi:homoserine/homoserine lactone efflux protein
MSLNAWILFFVAEAVLSLSPGPAVFYVVSQSLSSNKKRYFCVAASGIIAANGFYFILSATSLGALIATSNTIFLLAKWIGALYLLFLAWKSFKESLKAGDVDVMHQGSSARPKSLRRVFWGAIALQLSNPKSILLFLAILPQFIDASLPLAPQMSILAATSMIPELLILCGYGMLASAARHLVVGQRANQWLARVECLGLLGCAGMVATIQV